MVKCINLANCFSVFLNNGDFSGQYAIYQMQPFFSEPPMLLNSKSISFLINYSLKNNVQLHAKDKNQLDICFFREKRDE